MVTCECKAENPEPSVTSFAAFPDSRQGESFHGDGQSSALPMTYDVDSTQSQTIRDEITELERQLQDAKTRLNAMSGETLTRPVLEMPAASSTIMLNP